MKTRLLIIIGIVLTFVVLAISVYVISVQNRCESLLADTKYPRPLTFWNCLDYLNRVDNPPPKSSTVIPETQNPELTTRDDLKEVVYASTICSTFWRTNLFDMWENKTHDYKNDPIYQECREMLDAKNRCLGNGHIWNRNGTCTLTSVYPNGSGMGLKYSKYIAGTYIEDEN